MALKTPPRAIRYLLIALTVWLAMALLSYVAIPSYIKSIAIEQTEAHIGRKLALGEVRFNPLTLTLTANQVVLYDQDQTTPAFDAQEISASLSITSLLRLAPVFDEVKFVAPSVQIVRLTSDPVGTYNFSDIVTRILAQPKSDGNMAFAVSNIQIDQGKIVFDDKVSGKTIHIDDLHIGIPFISNFSGNIDSFVKPTLSATINGTPFALTGRSKPFSTTYETVLAIDIDKLDIANLLPFLPTSLPLSLQSAFISSQLELSFNEADNRPHIALSGELTLDQLALADHTNQALLKTRRATVTLNQFDVMNLAGTIQHLNIDAPEVWVALDNKGTLNWVTALAPKATTKSTPQVASAKQKTPSSPPAEQDAKPQSNPQKGIDFAQITITNGQIHWSDAAFAKPAQVVNLSALTLNAKQLSTTAGAAAGSLEFSAMDASNGKLSFDGTVDPIAIHIAGQAALTNVALGAYQHYINPHLNAKVTGKLSANSALSYKDAQFNLTALGLALDQITLTPTKSQPIQIKSITLADGNLSTATKRIDMQSLQVSGVQGALRRDKQGQLNLNTWLPETTTPTSATHKSPLPAAQTSPWVATLANFALLDSRINYQDDSSDAPQSVQISGINVKAENLSTQMDRVSPLSAQAKFNQQGTITLKGQSQAGFTKFDVNIDAKDIPVAPWQGFFTEFLNVQLARGNVSAKGHASLALPQNHVPLTLQFKGEANFNKFRVLNEITNSDFLRWNHLGLSGLDIHIGPARPTIQINKITLDNFFGRIVLSEQGRINLRDILVSEKAAMTASTTVDQKTISDAPVTSDVQPDTAPRIRVGEIVLAKGNINFSDNFIKPNYRANMTSLNGTIGTIDSDKVNPAPVDIKGKIDGDAPLVISGAINPLFKPLFLDIKGSAHGIEMTRLSPYSAKYAGYPIEKGKLSMDVTYKIQDDKLVAENDLSIDQLTFGAHVDGPDVTSLPVMLAVSLLKDRNGNINVNLPISGSLSDPQFSIGGVIMRVFVNLIMKAVTSPFALIGNMFGSSEELSNVNFEAGSAALNPEVIKRMDMINTAMVERPNLKLDIVGRADPKVDEAGIAEQRLMQEMRALKRQSLPRAERNNDFTLTPQEELKYLTEIYKKASFDKPKNAIGFTKSLPPEEMKALILQHSTVEKDDLHNLAIKRADAIRNYMQKEGNVPADRMFLVAPKITTTDLKSSENGARVDFALK
jgi:hypothetical protein